MKTKTTTTNERSNKQQYLYFNIFFGCICVAPILNECPTAFGCRLISFWKDWRMIWKYICDRISQLIWLPDEFCFYALCKHLIVKFDNFNRFFSLHLIIDLKFRFILMNVAWINTNNTKCTLSVSQPETKTFAIHFTKNVVLNVHTMNVLVFIYFTFVFWYLICIAWAHCLLLNFNAFRWRCDSSPLFKFSSIVLLRIIFTIIWFTSLYGHGFEEKRGISSFL